MKNRIALSLLLVGGIASADPLVVISTSSVGVAAPASTSTAAAPDVQASTAPPSVAITGETISAPAPQAMTDRTGAGVFVTLTRSALSNDQLPTNTQVVSQEDIRSLDAQNAGEALAYATSVAVPRQGQVGALELGGIRGATSNQTLVLIDGRPVGGSALSSSQDLSEIPVEQIDHIEIVRGGVSALYGPNAVGGVINVITRRSTYNGLPISHLNFETGSFNRQATRLDFGSRLGPVDYYFFGDQQRESGFRQNADARTHNIGGNAGLSLGRGGKLLFDAASFHANAGIPGQLFPDINPSRFNNEIEKQAATPNARQVTDTNYLRTSYLLPLPMDSLMTLRMFGSQREVTYKDPLYFVDTDRHEQSKGLEAQWNLPRGLLVGGNFLHDRLDSADHITPGNNFIASAENWGIFAQDTQHWKIMTFIPSARFDHNSAFGDTTNPRGQLLIDPTDWLRFSADAGRSFRAPTLDDLYTPFENFGFYSYQGNRNLKPETAWTYDAGFEVHQDSSSFKITYFRANTHNLIQTTSDLAATTVNVGQGRRQGAEVEVAHTMNTFWRTRWSYTYLANTGVPLGYDHFVPLRLSPRHTVNYVNTLTLWKNVVLDNALKYVSHEFEGNDEQYTRIGSHFTWDVRLGYQWRQLEIYGGMNDVTNKRYEERGGYPLPGRTIYGGLRLRLWG